MEVATRRASRSALFGVSARNIERPHQCFAFSDQARTDNLRHGAARQQPDAQMARYAFAASPDCAAAAKARGRAEGFMKLKGIAIGLADIKDGKVIPRKKYHNVCQRMAAKKKSAKVRVAKGAR